MKSMFYLAVKTKSPYLLIKILTKKDSEKDKVKLVI